MRAEGLHTVCEEAGCPNIGECWEAGTATFMILGDVCTRACKYCGVAHGMPNNLDLDEPRRVAETVARLELEHVVITSVNRDELPDGGAGIYAETIRRIQKCVASCSVEVLIPDFKGDEKALRVVVEAGPAIIGHNLETVERMGEESSEVTQAMADLRSAAVDILTLGQYLRPSSMHIPVARWVSPDEFAELKRIGEVEYGFKHVEAGPLVRSSYHAKEQAREVEAGTPGVIQEILEGDVLAPAEVSFEFVQLEVGRPGRPTQGASDG